MREAIGWLLASVFVLVGTASAAESPTGLPRTLRVLVAADEPPEIGEVIELPLVGRLTHRYARRAA